MKDDFLGRLADRDLQIKRLKEEISFCRTLTLFTVLAAFFVGMFIGRL
jgi:hypothetical protein